MAAPKFDTARHGRKGRRATGAVAVSLLAGAPVLGGAAALAVATEPHAAQPGADRPGSPRPGRFVTAVSGSGEAKQIRMYQRGKPDPVWTWNAGDAEKLLSGQDKGRKEIKDLFSCIRKGTSATEAKWAAGGKKITAILGSAAVVIDYPSKRVLFGACNNTSMHSLEMLPHDKLAVATTGKTKDDGVWVYDTRQKVADRPVQKMTGLLSAHALQWDQSGGTLWAAGTDTWPQTGRTVHGRLVGYAYDKSSSQPLSYDSRRDHTMRQSAALKEEFPGWKEGPHELTAVPHQRKLLVTTDRDVYAFDITTGRFTYDLSSSYFKGFTSPTPTRNSHGIPRSGMKSLSLSAAGDFLYTSNDWGLDFTKEARFFDKGTKRPRASSVKLPRDIYKARWFAGTPGWPTAR